MVTIPRAKIKLVRPVSISSFRNKELDTVLKTIRFRQITTKFLQTRILPELVKGEGKCRKDVEDALAARKLSQENNDSGKPRNSRKIVYLFSMKTNRVDTFDEEQRACVPCLKLTSFSDASKEDNYHCAFLVQGELYIVSRRAVNRFNPVTKKWTWVGDGKFFSSLGFFYQFRERSTISRVCWIMFLS